MPLNPINFLNAPVSRHPLAGALDALAKGYQIGQMPAQMAEEQKQRQLANAYAQMRNENEPERFAEEIAGTKLDNAAKTMSNKNYPAKFAAEQEDRELGNVEKKFNNGINKMFGIDLAKAKLDLTKAQAEKEREGGSLTGVAGESYGIQKLKDKYGEEGDASTNPYKRAQKAFDTKTALQEGLINYRGSLTENADKRAASPLAKLQMERSEIQQGFYPGSGKTLPLSPEEQESMLGQYDKEIHKRTTFADAAARSLLSSNMEKTIKRINVDDLVRYSGAEGSAKKFAEEAKAPFGKQSKEYTAFTNSLAAAETLATQVRAFYKDSIQPAMLKRLEKLTNPSTWLKSPELAKENYEAVVDILHAEGETYSNANRNADEYTGKSNEAKPKSNSDKKPSGPPPPGTVLGYLDGWHYIPKDQVEKFLKTKGASIDG